MSTIATLEVKIGANMRGFNRAMDQFAGRLKGMGEVASRAGSMLSTRLTPPSSGVDK